MGPPSKKRKLNANSKPQALSQFKPKSLRKAVGTDPRKNVRLDELAWQHVKIPKGLDDYEGIYGLEEVDDVEVVRDPETRLISYRAVEQKVTTKNNSGTIHENASNALLSDDEEWEGLGSDRGASAGEEEMDAGSVEEQESSEESDALPNGNGTQPSQFGSVPFSGLEEVNLDNEDLTDISAWSDLGLSSEILSSLSALGYSTPTPIQKAAIPEIITGRDVIGKASTGSGKTLAFGIPIVERYLSMDAQWDNKTKEKTPLALVLSPTRELAHQLAAHLQSLCDGGPYDAPSIVTVTGGLSLLKQERKLEGADIVVGTPGRLWELMSNGESLLEKLKQIRFLVIDEADRLLSQGHYQELQEIIEALDKQDTTENGKPKKKPSSKRQTLVFSATFHKGLQQKLAGKGKPTGDLMSQKESMEYLLQKLNFREEQPKFIDVNPISQMATGLREGILECGGMEKDLYLYFLLLLYPTSHVLIFTNSITSVRRLTPLLNELQIPLVMPLHSQMPQKSRLRSVERFSATKKSSILIATDVAARGLDIPAVDLVIHYHVPRAADAYVHRSGRTARAGLQGSSVLLCAPEEVGGVRRLVAKVHAGSKEAGKQRALKTLDVDRKAVIRLKQRVELAKRIADVGLAKEKKAGGDRLFREAAEDLGVEYDSEELDKGAKGKRGRGEGRKRKAREDREVTKAEVQGMRASLREMLARRVNAGVSEKYLTGGGVDIDALLKGQKDEFLGGVRGLDFEV